MNEISFLYFCVVNETKTLCLLIAVSLKFKKQNARRKKQLMSIFGTMQWIFQERFGGNDNNMYTGLCMRTSSYVCVLLCMLCYAHPPQLSLSFNILVYVHLTETKTKVKETNIDFPKKLIENQCSLILFFHLFS